MEKLKHLMTFFIKEFPQSLGRTQLIKAIYLLDCEWYAIHGTTYSGLQYYRDKNGPFDSTFYEAKDQLIDEEIIVELPYVHQKGQGYQFEYVGKEFDETLLHPMALDIARDIVDRLTYADTKKFLDEAYNTLPMLVVLEKESKSGCKLHGEELPMNELNKPLDPLFTLDEVQEALKQINFVDCGSDEEYNAVVFSEFVQLSKTRERVRMAWKLQTGEKL